MSVLRSLAFGLSLVLSSAALAGAPGALASEGETAKIDSRAEPLQDVDPCEAASRVKLKITAESDGHLEVVGVVYSEGEDTWFWKFKHDDDFSARGKVVAQDREVDRSFRIVRSMVNFEGPDTVTFRAINDATNELCVQELVFREDVGVRARLRDSLR
jgi:hypothetical protein